MRTALRLIRWDQFEFNAKLRNHRLCRHTHYKSHSNGDQESVVWQKISFKIGEKAHFYFIEWFNSKSHSNSIIPVSPFPLPTKPSANPHFRCMIITWLNLVTISIITNATSFAWTKPKHSTHFSFWMSHSTLFVSPFDCPNVAQPIYVAQQKIELKIYAIARLLYSLGIRDWPWIEWTVVTIYKSNFWNATNAFYALLYLGIFCNMFSIRD